MYTDMNLFTFTVFKSIYHIDGQPAFVELWIPVSIC